jgi:hypothetical protein
MPQAGHKAVRYPRYTTTKRSGDAKSDEILSEQLLHDIHGDDTESIYHSPWVG